MIQNIEKNSVTIKCDGCGTVFSLHTEADLTDTENMFVAALRHIYGNTMCDKCAADRKKELARQKEQERRAALADSLLEREEKAGFPRNFRGLEKPYIRQAAVFFYENRDSSLIVSGKTGTGKTSSALYVLGLMLSENYLRVKYCTRQTLLAAYTRAKTSNEDSEEAFFERLGWYDYIVIDELVGKKGDAALTDSAQELFFNLIDGAYSGERKAKLWILGNFYKGAIDNLVADPEPYKRRIRACFRPALFKLNKDESDVTVTQNITIS
jgi:DNA replication protein DnaC